MKLPTFEAGQVQNLQRADLESAAAPGLAAAKAWQATSGVFAELQKIQDEQEVLSATIDAQRNINQRKLELTTKKYYKASEVPDYVQVRREDEVLGADGTTSKVARDMIPAHEVMPQLFKADLQRYISTAANKISNGQVRQQWLARMGYKSLDDEAFIEKHAVTAQVEDLKTRELYNIEALQKNGDYAGAVSLVRSSRLLSAPEKKKTQDHIESESILAPVEEAMASMDLKVKREAIAMVQSQEAIGILGERKAAIALRRLQTSLRQTQDYLRNQADAAESRARTRAFHSVAAKIVADPTYVMSSQERALTAAHAPQLDALRMHGGPIDGATSAVNLNAAQYEISTNPAKFATMSPDQVMANFSGKLNPGDALKIVDYWERLRSNNPEAVKTAGENHIFKRAAQRIGLNLDPKPDNISSMERVGFLKSKFDEAVQAKRRAQGGFISDREVEGIAQQVLFDSTKPGIFGASRVTSRDLSAKAYRSAAGIMQQAGLPAHDLRWAVELNDNPTLVQTEIFKRYIDYTRSKRVQPTFDAFQQFRNVVNSK